MEERKTIFDYLAQVMIIFGFSMLIMNVFCLAFGNSAKGFSTMFELGNQGVPVKITFEFLCLSALITGIRYLFFTDFIIKKMPVWARTICMLTSVVIITSAFIIIFGWFPADQWQLWGMFFICFGISFIGSYSAITIKEKTENKKMEAALQRLKEKEKTHNE